MENSKIIQVSPSTLPPKNDTVKSSQEILNLFTRAPRATGGQIRTSKTKCYLLEFLWDLYEKLRLSDNSPKLTIDSKDVRKSIECLLTSQAYRILGVWKLQMDH